MYYKLISCIAIMVIFNSCKKKCEQKQYVIKATIVEGTTNSVYYNLNVELKYDENNRNGPRKWVHLASGVTDSNGQVILRYMACDEDNFYPLVVPANYPSGFDVPIRQNITQDFYVSYLGKLKVNFKTKNPLQINDTLFIGYLYKNVMTFDTLTKANIPQNKIYKTNNWSLNFFYGRGYKGFKYDKKANGFRISSDTTYQITGDPTIDEVELNY